MPPIEYVNAHFECQGQEADGSPCADATYSGAEFQEEFLKASLQFLENDEIHFALGCFSFCFLDQCNPIKELNDFLARNEDAIIATSHNQGANAEERAAGESLHWLVKL